MNIERHEEQAPGLKTELSTLNFQHKNELLTTNYSCEFCAFLRLIKGPGWGEQFA